MEIITMKIRTFKLLALSVLLFALFACGSFPKTALAEPIDLYGVTVDETTEYIDLRRRHIEDNGQALLAALPSLSSARYLDLDNCGLSEERILEIRDLYPDIKVIWRVNFIGMYSVRTDVKTILASYVGDGGLTDDASCKPLTYCEDVVNLDLGHNNHLRTLEFVRNMPELEVLIVAKDNIQDISPLADCKKLRYLEIYKNPDISDLSPLAGLTELRDLQIGMLPNVTDLSPLYDLELDRLWIGTQTPIPADQVAEYSRRHPNCEINLTDDAIDMSWRSIYGVGLSPKYLEIREIFNYGSDSSWSMAANDPYFYKPAGTIPPAYESMAEIRGKEVLAEMRSGSLPAPDEGGVLVLAGLTSSDVPALLSSLPQRTDISVVDLGDDQRSPIAWEDIRALQLACPNITFRYSFNLYGKPFTLSDTVMDLNHITIQDQGELVRRILPCMQNLELLDMDFCHVDDEHMAAIRDDFPNIKVVWRVWFGGSYSVRTDVEKILASSPGVAGNLTVNNTQSLRYCTEVKYLDVGHNEILRDISYVAYMPKLEVAILAMLNVEDISPLANCPELEYLEIQTNKITDLSPLKDLKKLHQLNIGYNFELYDISPLYGLTELERLWIGAFTPIPWQQVAEMMQRVPKCEINTDATDPHADWRWGNERYDLLVQQFGYDRAAYSYSWLDPLYQPHD